MLIYLIIILSLLYIHSFPFFGEWRLKTANAIVSNLHRKKEY